MRYPCDVELIAFHRRCGGLPARPFTAQCACGHQITGHMCQVCALSSSPGCFTCWKDGRGHQCRAQFDAAVLTGGA